MLPFCDRALSASRKEFLTLHSRGTPIPIKATTIGGNLRRRRAQLRLFQSQAARLLGVSTVTLSRWEGDKIYPTPEYHPAIITYLGHDPFKNIPHPKLSKLESNESHGVAFLPPAQRIGPEIKRSRLERKMTKEQCAKLLGVHPRTLRDWESGKHQPIGPAKVRLGSFLGAQPPAVIPILAEREN